MTTFPTMNQTVCNRLGDKLTKFCSPITDFLGINHFYHFIITNSGHYAAVGLNQAWQEYLHSNLMEVQLNYFYQHREKLNGIVFSQTIPNKEWQNVAKTANKSYNINLGLQISHKTKDGIEGFGFSLKTDDHLQHMALLNELPLLNIFISQYKSQFRDDILRENLVDVPLIDTPITESPNLREAVLGKMKIKVANPFSKRELEVIKELLKGCPTYSQVAEALYLSKRTVEDHVENIKNKTECYSKSELIKKLRELESFGFII